MITPPASRTSTTCAGDVPHVVVEGPVAVESAGRNVRQIHGRRAGPAQRACVQRKVAPPLERALLALHVRREPGGQQRLVEPGGPTGRQASIAQPGPVPAGRGEQLLPNRVQDHADDQLASHLQADGDAIERKIVDVVGGAVNWVNDPGRRRVRRDTLLLAAGSAGRRSGLFLSKKTMIGVVLTQEALDRLL